MTDPELKAALSATIRGGKLKKQISPAYLFGLAHLLSQAAKVLSEDAPQNTFLIQALRDAAKELEP
jgi:hypothetical protein